jgi:hypothetical protein
MNASQIDPPATESVTAQPEERSELLAWARRIGAAVAAGMLAGLVVGGIGGRVAMFTLRVTSSSRVTGIESDDGFRIGQISTATFFLLLITTNHYILHRAPVHLVERTIPNPLELLFSASNLYYWTIAHVTLSFFPRTIPVTK